MDGKINQLLIDSNDPNSLASRKRAARWAVLESYFPDLASMTVIDLGGTADFWRNADVRPVKVTLVNLMDDPCDESWLEFVSADACQVPIKARFDVVISNSLIEHVGGHYRRQQLADEIHRLADLHWVQTPYRYFPVEPHWLFPGFQFLPISAKSRITEKWPLGSMRSQDEAAVAQALDTELVSLSEMRHYFPESEIWKERFAGLIKSVVAVKAPVSR